MEKITPLTISHYEKTKDGYRAYVQGYSDTLEQRVTMLTVQSGTILESEVKEIAAYIIKAANLFPELVQWLNVILDQVDYMSGACAVTEMVGAALDRRVIEQARAVLAKAKASSVPDTYSQQIDPPTT